MRHLCKNFIYDGFCSKCRRPEWSLYFPVFNHQIGDEVKIPDEYRWRGGEKAIITGKTKQGFIIQFKEDETTTEWYEWWELLPLRRD
jgi:hypothetical protein